MLNPNSKPWSQRDAGMAIEIFSKILQLRDLCLASSRSLGQISDISSHIIILHLHLFVPKFQCLVSGYDLPHDQYATLVR